MKILISGSTGFVGSRLSPYLEDKGYDIYSLVQRKIGLRNEILWNPQKNLIEKDKIPDDITAVVNLAGENISEGKWDNDKKTRILESRINSTKLLINALQEINIKTNVWINASASGFYGNTNDMLNTEESPAGNFFLSNVCKNWEAEALKADRISNRVVILRFGVILDKEGGALKKILPIFQNGLGGNLGTGKQYFPWIALDDILEIIDFAINKPISGVYNTTSPSIITNHDFTIALSNVLKKPALFNTPELVLKLLLGTMAQETLLASTRMSSDKLTNIGYKFIHIDIENFLMQNLNS